MFCLYTTGEGTLEEIRWCICIHVEQLYSPYVYANKRQMAHPAEIQEEGKKLRC